MIKQGLSNFRQFKVPLFVVVFAGILDIATTIYALSIGASEVNPIAGIFGLPAFLAFKLLVGFGVTAWIIFRNADKVKLYVIAGVLAVIPMWNLIAIIIQVINK